MPGKAQDHRELQACNYSYQKLQTQTTHYLQIYSNSKSSNNNLPAAKHKNDKTKTDHNRRA